MKVLLVDDHEPTLRLQSAIMERAGWETRGASGVDGALAMAAEWQPDLILLDLSMPGRDGLEVLIALRLCHLCHVIAVSGLGRRRLWPVVQELGGSEYFEKGTDPQELIRLVENVMDTEVPPRRYMEDLQRRTLELV